MVDKEVVLKRAKNAVISRDFSLASRLYKSLLAEDSSNIELLFALGNLYIKASDDENALRYFEQIVTFSPNNIEAYINMGGIFRRLKRYEESIVILNKALDLGADKNEVNYNLGFTYKVMGEDKQACECFESVISNNPTDVLAYNHLGSIYASKKDYQKSISIYKKALQIDPNHPILQFNLGKSYVSIHQDADAFIAFESALKAKPNWVDAVKEYVLLLLKYSKTKEASDILLNCLNVNPDDYMLYYYLGTTYLFQSDFNKAIKSLEKALAINKTDFNIYIQLILTYELMKEHKTAYSIAKEAVEMFPDNVEVLKMQIFVLFSLNKLNKGALILKQISESLSRDPYIKDYMGQYYILCDNKKSVALCFDKIEKLNPSYKDYFLSAAYRYRQIKKYNEAIKCLKVYNAVKQRNPLAYILYAEIEIERGNVQTAIDLLNKSLELNPNLTVSHAMLDKLLSNNKIVIDSEENSEESIFEDEDIELNEDDILEEFENKNSSEEQKDVTEENKEEIENVEAIDEDLEEDFNLDDFKDTILEHDEKLDPFDFEEAKEEFLDEETFLEPSLEENTEEEEKNIEDDEEEQQNKTVILGSSIGGGESALNNKDENLEISELQDEELKEDYLNVEEAKDQLNTESLGEENNKNNDDSFINNNYENLKEQKESLYNENDEKLKELLNKTQAQVDKAVNSAEKAWDAAQKAADSAQSASSSEEYINNLAQETAQKAAEKATESIDEKIKEAVKELQLSMNNSNDIENSNKEDDNLETELEQEEIAEESQNVNESQPSSVISLISKLLCNGDLEKKYHNKIELFKKLRSLSDYLPESKKDSFLKSKTRILLDYIISCLSGNPGLLKTSVTLRKSGVIDNLTGEVTPETESLVGKDLVIRVLNNTKELAKDLQDKELSEGLQNIADEVLEKINNV